MQRMDACHCWLLIGIDDGDGCWSFLASHPFPVAVNSRYRLLPPVTSEHYILITFTSWQQHAASFPWVSMVTTGPSKSLKTWHLQPTYAVETGTSLRSYSLFFTCSILLLPSDILSWALFTLTGHFCRRPVHRLLGQRYRTNAVDPDLVLTTSVYTLSSWLSPHGLILSCFLIIVYLPPFSRFIKTDRTFRPNGFPLLDLTSVT